MNALEQEIVSLIDQAPSTPEAERIRYRDRTIAVVMASWNEEGKVAPCVQAVPRGIVDTVCVVDDASTDATAQEGRDAGAVVISHPRNLGAGAGYRTGYHYAKRHGFDIVVELAGDNQDDPNDIQRVVDHLIDEELDYVQGSRYAKGGQQINMTRSRQGLTRIYSWLFNRMYRAKISDATNGFRAFYTRVLDDPKIQLFQSWLNRYELEPYLLVKVHQLGYKVGEAPVRKIYHDDMSANTKMVPFKSWYSIIRPLFLLRFGVRA